jgi:D-erythronate 2-dehydrogenase
MHIVITGGCGFLGRRVAMRLLDRGTAGGPIDELVLFDNAPPALPLPEDRRLSVVTGDIADRTTGASLIGPGTDAVFHLAAIVSGQAEADTDLGYRVNLDGTRAVLDACRALGTAPKLIFASSLAVYGGALPQEVGENTALTPQSSYGKAPTARRRRSANCWLMITAARALSTAWRCGCRPSSCAPACRTAPPRLSPRR